MIPTNTGRTSPCDPISSNCVIWQGPQLDCIDVCQGDTISDVTAKIAEELCDLIEGTCLCDPDMSSIDLGCIGTGTAGTIQEVTAQIIAYLCSLEPGSSGETICDYPECMWHLAPDGVTMIKSDTICNYVDYLSKRICALVELYNILELRVTTNAGNIAILMDNQVEPYVPPELLAACPIIAKAVGSSNLVGLDLLLHAVQVTLCDLMAALGTSSNMSYAMSSNLCALTGDPILNQPQGSTNTYGTLPRWLDSVNNFSASFNNMWVAFCDMRSAIQTIQINCCDIGCEDITYDFGVSIINPGSVTGFLFTFTEAHIPAPFADCGAGSKISVTDAIGNTTSSPVNIFSLQSSLTGATLNLDGLDPLSVYTCTVHFCFNNGNQQCEYTMTKDIPNDFTCPITVNTGPFTDTTCPFNFTNDLGTNVIYNVQAINVATGIQQGGEVNFFPETPGTPTGEITGLSPATDYYLQITITNGSDITISTVCPFTLFTTFPTTCTSTMALFGVDYVSDPVIAVAHIIGIYDGGGGPGFKRTWSMGSNNTTGEPEVLEFEEVGVGVPSIINGENLGVSTVNCGATPFPFAPNTAYLLPSTFTADNGVDYYIYGFWGPDPFGVGGLFLNGVVICCVCPTILMDQHWNGERNIPFIFTPTLPFGAVSSQAIPIAPVNGSAISTGAGTFTYTNTGPGMTDSFGVTVTTGCGPSDVATMTVQISTSDPVLDQEADIYIFIDSGSVTSADAIDIHQGVLDFVAQMALDACTYNGNVYVLSLDHGNWLDYQKAIVDEGVSLTGLAAIAPYPNVWPVEWPAGTGPALNDKQNVLLLAFCNESDGVGGYHNPNVLPDPYNLTSGPNVQPSGSFMAGFDEFMDGFYGDSDPVAHPPATVTTWGALQVGWGGFDKFRAVLFSETLAGTGATKASNIMQLEAMEMRKIPDNEFIGYQMTDPGTVENYVTPAYGPVIPYVGVTTPALGGVTPGGNLLEPLKTRGWLISMNQLGPAFDWGANMEAMAKDAAIGDDTCPDVP